ncbi:MAG: dimethylargininase [Elusimicrobia bacterium]|nr:dimethylargininase [Elusimicrobiota bacterium]
MAGVKYLAKPFDTRRLGQLLEEIVPKAAFIAFTRAVSPQMARCELTHLERSVIDVKRAAAQHEAYEKALSKAGCDVRRLSAAPDLPDSVFVEDAAVVFDELAVIARPGAETRRGEVVEVEKALSGLRHLEKIESPGTLDGGDVLVAGKRVFAGRTARTNDEGIRQLGLLLAPRGYVVAAVPVTGCLHLKSAVTAFDENSLLINSKWVPRDAFPGFDLLEIDPSEPYAANVLKLGETLIMPSAFPKTRARLEREWKKPVIVDADELAKAEGAVTCCSLIAARRPGEPRAGC